MKPFENQYLDMLQRFLEEVKMKPFENQYLDMLQRVLDEGVYIPDRTGVGTLAVFDHKLTIDEGEYPFSTIRSCPIRMAFEEFWFFLNGKTQTKELEEKGINFWKGNTSKEFLSKRGLGHLDEGDLGFAYGSQLRAYGKSTIFGVEGKDQLVDTYETLKSDKYSRRVYNTMWNPNESHLMALTPCWHSHQFVVLPDEDGNDVLHLKLFSRSLDSVFGAMYAIQQYRLYQMCMAKLLGFNVGKLSCDLTQIHIYLNQIEYAEEILTRSFGFDVDAYDINRININKDLNTLGDLLTMQWADFEINHPIVNKEPFVTPRPPMAA